MTSNETKQCPFCSEDILTTAKKCKHCGEWLEESENSSSRQSPVDSVTMIRQALAYKYEILEEIGKGGMASVYKAKQKNLNRFVALKVIHQNLVHDEEFLQRFHREAEVAASLSHPNITTVYDVGREGSVHYLSMEYIEGENLSQIIKKKKRLDINEVLEIVEPITAALDYAHDEGLVHRDIKCSNIIVSNKGKPILTDFGIAHAASGTKLTKTGAVLGTPAYMSPEQAQGLEIDLRSDLYSLGVVMYECVSGEVPFIEETPIATSLKIINERPIELKKIVAISDVYNDVIMKLLEKEKGKRFQTGIQLCEALAKINISDKAPESVKRNSEIFSNNLSSNINKPLSDHSEIKKQKSIERNHTYNLKEMFSAINTKFGDKNILFLSCIPIFYGLLLIVDTLIIIPFELRDFLFSWLTVVIILGLLFIRTVRFRVLGIFLLIFSFLRFIDDTNFVYISPALIWAILILGVGVHLFTTSLNKKSKITKEWFDENEK